MKSKSSQQVLITDGFWRKSLSAARALGKEGYEVSVMGDSLFTTAFWSRYTKQRILAPLASYHPEEFGKALLTHIRNAPQSVLLPMEDPTLEWVVQHQKEIEALGCSLLVPNQESLQIALDKGKTLEKARELKIPYPETIELETLNQFADHFDKLPPGRFIAKPRTGTRSKGLIYASKRSYEEWEKHWTTFGPMIIQERIPSHGNAYGVSLLMDRDGDCVAHFAHQRRHQYPLTGGPSTDRWSVLAPELVEQSIRLLKSLKWKGVAMVEWKTDPRDKRTKLMEINPRFWGSLELAVRSGVNFPKLYVQAALGEKLLPLNHYSIGVRCRWLLPGELLRYFNQSHIERESLRRFFRGLPGNAEEWDLKDLNGFAASIICTGVKVVLPKIWKSITGQ